VDRHAWHHDHVQHDWARGASATFTLNQTSAQAGDKVTLWYQNQSFISPAIIPGNPTTDQALWWQDRWRLQTKRCGGRERGL